SALRQHLASPESTGIPLEHTGDYGVYGVVDQTLYRVPGTDDQGLSGFARAGGVPNDRNLCGASRCGCSRDLETHQVGLVCFWLLRWLRPLGSGRLTRGCRLLPSLAVAAFFPTRPFERFGASTR